MVISITVAMPATLKIHQNIREKDVVNDGLPRNRRRPMLLCKVNSRGTCVEGNDLLRAEQAWAAASVMKPIRPQPLIKSTLGAFNMYNETHKIASV